MATYEILYWHDIPVQVRAGSRRNRVSQELPARFQEAVDRAAMAANLVGTDEYLRHFRWDSRHEREGTPQEVVAAVTAELDEQHAQIRSEWLRPHPVEPGARHCIRARR